LSGLASLNYTYALEQLASVHEAFQSLAGPLAWNSLSPEIKTSLTLGVSDSSLAG